MLGHNLLYLPHNLLFCAAGAAGEGRVEQCLQLAGVLHILCGLLPVHAGLLSAHGGCSQRRLPRAVCHVETATSHTAAPTLQMAGRPPRQRCVVGRTLLHSGSCPVSDPPECCMAVIMSAHQSQIQTVHAGKSLNATLQAVRLILPCRYNIGTTVTLADQFPSVQIDTGRAVSPLLFC